MVLGIETVASRSSVVLHIIILKLSSERRTIGVRGISTVAENLLFSILQVPVLPSLKDRATGTQASFVMDAHPVKVHIVIAVIIASFIFLIPG